jgi:hypothetical protein
MRTAAACMSAPLQRRGSVSFAALGKQLAWPPQRYRHACVRQRVRYSRAYSRPYRRNRGRAFVLARGKVARPSGAIESVS